MKAVLFVHGNPGSPLIFQDLAKEFNSEKFFVDLPGLGFSQAATPKSVGDVFECVRVQVKDIFEKSFEFTLIGHDWGVPVCIFLASIWRPKIRNMVFFNTAIGEFNKLPNWLRFFGKFPATGPIFVFLAALNARNPLTILRPYLSSKIFNVSKYISFVPSTNLPTFLAKVYLDAYRAKIFEIPTLIFWGLKDPCLKIEHLVDLKSKFLNSSTYIIESGHFVPGELSNESKSELLKFINKSEFNKGSQLLDLFDDQIRSLKSLPAIIEADLSNSSYLSFKDLDVKTYKIQRELRKHGLKNQFLLLAIRPWSTFVPVFLACLRERVIPVLIDPKIEFKNLILALKSIPNLKILTSIKGWFLSHLLEVFGLKIKKYLFSFGKLYGSNLNRQQVEVPNDILFVAFTSGGTGVPKPVVFTEEMVLTQLGIFKSYLNMDGYGVDFPVTNAFFIFNLFLGRASLFIKGKSQVTDYNYDNLVKIITTHQVSHIFGSTYFWQRLIDASLIQSEDLSFIKKGIISGAPLYRSFVKKILERSRFNIIGAYGSTEALPVSFYDLKQSLQPGPGLFIGKPLVEYRINPEGELLVHGKNVSQKYLVESLNKELKVKVNECIFHRMGDIVREENGNLFILGRKDDCDPFGNYFPYELEDKLMENLNISECVTIHDNGKIYFFTSEIIKNEEVKKLVKDITGKDVEVKFVKQIPRDLRHNSKTLRSKLRDLI